MSIVLNIAEGSGRNTEKELNRFFDIAIGSLNETVAGLDSLTRIKQINKGEFEFLFEKLAEVSRQLGGFKKSLKRGL